MTKNSVCIFKKKRLKDIFYTVYSKPGFEDIVLAKSGSIKTVKSKVNKIF